MRSFFLAVPLVFLGFSAYAACPNDDPYRVTASGRVVMEKDDCRQKTAQSKRYIPTCPARWQPIDIGADSVKPAALAAYPLSYVRRGFVCVPWPAFD